MSMAMKNQERHHLRQQRIDVVDQQHLGGGDNRRSGERAKQAVEPADECGREGLEPMMAMV